MNKAFTLIETGIVIAVIAVLVSISTMALTTFQNHTYITNTVETIISDIKHQQLKAMSGSTESQTNISSYGIYFESNQYTLFQGNVYDANNQTNFIIPLNESLEFTNIRFPNGLLIFNKGSGEINGYSSSNNSISLYNSSTNENKTITINRYGVIISVN